MGCKQKWEANACLFFVFSSHRRNGVITFEALAATFEHEVMEASHIKATTWKEVVPATRECHPNQDQLHSDFLNIGKMFPAHWIHFFVACSQINLSKTTHSVLSHLIFIAYKVPQQWLARFSFKVLVASINKQRGDQNIAEFWLLMNLLADLHFLYFTCYKVAFLCSE